MDYTLESMQSNLKIKYLNNIINGCDKNNINCDHIKDKINGKQIQTQTERDNDKYSATEKMTETETMDYLYLKPWSKITQIHKIIKIKEFVKNLEIKNQNKSEKLKDTLIELIKDKKIKIKINYDSTKGKIISIANLSYDNNEYVLNLNV